MILNQLVTEFLFKGNTERLEKYNKDLETSKKKLSELKESQKDFNKFFREEEKKLKDELKSLNLSDFTSAKTKNLRKSLADIKDAIKIEQLKDNPDRATVKSLKRREYRLSKGLTASEAKDKRELEKITTATNKQFKDTQKNHKIAMAQAEEKIETEKESQEATKEKIKEENQGNGITEEQWLEMMKFFNWKCAYSGEYIGGNSKERTIDHIIPLNKGGEHEVWNCVPMLRSLNCRKQDKDMLSWYKGQSFYNKWRLNKIQKWQEYAHDKWGK